MIKSEFGEVTIKGFRGMIRIDLEVVIRALLEKKISTKEDILEIVDNATKTEDERVAEEKAKAEAKANAKPDRISPVDLLKGLAAMAEMMEKEMQDE
jgi:hypothetical protein